MNSIFRGPGLALFHFSTLQPARTSTSACKTRVSDLIDGRIELRTQPARPRARTTTVLVMFSVTAAAPCMDFAGFLRIVWAAAAISAAAVSAANHCTTSSDCVFSAKHPGGGGSWRCEMGICVPITLVTRRDRHGVRYT